jgi:hypothetical protein
MWLLILLYLEYNYMIVSLMIFIWSSKIKGCEICDLTLLRVSTFQSDKRNCAQTRTVDWLQIWPNCGYVIRNSTWL